VSVPLQMFGQHAKQHVLRENDTPQLGSARQYPLIRNGIVRIVLGGYRTSTPRRRSCSVIGPGTWTSMYNVTPMMLGPIRCPWPAFAK
jgi:hypothetical protein